MAGKYKNKLMCEIMSQDVLPSLRAFIAKELILEYKMNQIVVAGWLGVSQPAISQYIRQLRGFNESLMKHETVNKEVKNLCEKLTANNIKKENMITELDNICKMAATILLESDKNQKELTQAPSDA